MLYDLNNPLQRENFKLRCNALFKKGGIVDLTEKKRRTNKQNRYLHLILSYFGINFGYSTDEVKIGIFKLMCNRDLFFLDDTLGFPRLKSTKDLSVHEMTDAIERFRKFSAEQGLYIPSPDEEDMMDEVDVEVSRQSSYL